jgi:hypothetical protein
MSKEEFDMEEEEDNAFEAQRLCPVKLRGRTTWVKLNTSDTRASMPSIDRATEVNRKTSSLEGGIVSTELKEER